MNRRSASLDADRRTAAGEDVPGLRAKAPSMAGRGTGRSGGEDVEVEQPIPNLERLVADAMYMAAATGGAGPELANLVNRYWRLVPDEDLEGRTARQMLTATQAHLELARQRLPGELKIGVARTAEHTVLQIVTDDMPFLVDSITAAITSAKLDLDLFVHPQVVVRRETLGALIEVRPRKERGAAIIVAAIPPAASSSRTTVQSTMTFWSAAPDHSIKVTAMAWLRPPEIARNTRGSVIAAA